MKKTSDAEKTKILKKALATGEWDIAPSAAFPRGRADLAVYFAEWADAGMILRLEKEDLPALRVRDRVARGVRARLEILEPHKDAVRENLRYLAPPPRHARLPGLVWRTADAIWRAAGDTATDYNHYTKRLLLAGVLTATTLFWLNDTSPKHEKTWRFLDRRIDNVLKLGSLSAKLRNTDIGAKLRNTDLAAKLRKTGLKEKLEKTGLAEKLRGGKELARARGEKASARLRGLKASAARARR